jgi:hypothetical protein
MDDVIDSRDVISRLEELEALRKPWVAGCNMLGYMPDSEPSQFETYEDARQFIADQIRQAAEHIESDEEAKPYEEAAERWEDAASADEAEQGETIGNYHYWIAKAEEPFEDCSDALEFETLKTFADEAEGYAPDWTYGATLVRDSYFTTYAQELCEDIGDVPRNLPSYIEIDWEATARNIRQDYTSVEFDGVTYWVR